MREIKFRAYIKNNKRVSDETNKIVEVKSLHLGSKRAIIGYSKSPSNYGNYSISFNDIELMQYTGLKDKNRKEIYEGDIVKQNEILYEIIYSDADASFIQFSKEYNYISRINNEDLEVIGNIHDNKELLEVD